MKSSHQTVISTLLLTLIPLSLSSSTNSTFPKRGLCYIATDHSTSDSALFTRPNSPLTWYYNYSPWPGPGSSLTQWSTEFVPMVHSASDAQASVDTLKSVLNGSAGIPISNSNSGSGQGNQISYVLTFNEPDGDTSSGGTESSPSAAAQVYIDTILPLRQPPYNLKISLPATTGSPQGLQWLTSFNSSCFKINKSAGCEFDFVAAHWYGDFAGLGSWVDQLHALYPSKPIWITEFAIPSVDLNETQAFMNQSLPYLDGLNYVQRYAWFGAFREDDANEWTGDSVSLLDKEGHLTGLGAEYLGGEEDGFEEGTGVSGNGSGGLRWKGWLLMLTVLVSLWQCL